MTESIQITELSMKDYEFVNRAYHVLHKEHVNGRPDIYVDTEELLTREEYQEILESDEYVAVGAKAGEKLVGAVIAKKKGNTGKPHAEKESYTLY